MTRTLNFAFSFLALACLGLCLTGCSESADVAEIDIDSTVGMTSVDNSSCCGKCASEDPSASCCGGCKSEQAVSTASESGCTKCQKDTAVTAATAGGCTKCQSCADGSAVSTAGQCCKDKTASTNAASEPCSENCNACAEGDSENCKCQHDSTKAESDSAK